MSTWLGKNIVTPFLSLNGAIALSIIALVLGYMLFVAGWVWALLAAGRGSRAGLIVALIFSLLVGGGLLTILFFCPVGCSAQPVGDSIVRINLVSGLVAAAALGRQFIRVW
jgi:hypothetical protein